MADASSSTRLGEIAASWERKLMVRLLEEVDLGEHHLFEVSDTVEIDDAVARTREDYVEEGTGRGHF